MNTSTIALLLQMTSSLLAGAHNNAAVPPAALAEIAGLGNRTVQIAVQALAPIDFPVATNTDMWPTVTDLMASPYLDAEGNYVRAGGAVQLDQSSVSFGDLNSDGFDDAAAIVTRKMADGTTQDAIAVFLNQGNIMFNIADLPLGSSATVYSHNINANMLTMNMRIAGGARATTTYELVGNQIKEVE